MKEQFKKRLTKKQIFSIPNILSYIRILLVPAIIVLYCVYGLYYWSAGLIVFSAITDVADGFIARKFNMVTDFGKFIDPVADKITQCAMVFCASMINWWVCFLLVCMLTREILLFLWGLMLFRKQDRVSCSCWYGKASTVIVYASMFSLFIFPFMPEKIVAILFSTCFIAVALSTILYGNYYYSIFRKLKKEKAETQN
ncbi:MAG: CDP-alcohol phosphatidyltransferase family protein [Clostridia bacterium]|nr:CDP-alcohol phosphatidyltransferase family protein [Clostridia bacterium]